MNDKLWLKLETISILNDFQREHINRQVRVYGCSMTDGAKDYWVDSHLKALALAVSESGQCGLVGLGEVDILKLSDDELLNTFHYQFAIRAIVLNGLAVWNYESECGICAVI